VRHVREISFHHRRFQPDFEPSGIAGAKTVNGQALDARQRSIALISAFTAKGDLDRLKTALNEGLDSGLTVNEIKEVLAQLYAYAGFPRSHERWRMDERK
jgi:alkylhydroperoxidase/carboxymuconolactone decarboxylase family protein YurZ